MKINRSRLLQQVEELARIIATIPHEISCGRGKRVKRVYTEQNAALTEGLAHFQRGVA